MNPKKLGKTGLTVSELGFGGIPITRIDWDEAVALIRSAYDRGITFFDTANLYGDSEAKLGQALGPVRDKVVIASKTLVRDRAGAREQIENSLRQLNTDYVDLYQLHNVSAQEQLDQVLAGGGAYEALDEARRRGDIRHIGISSHNIDVAVEACRTGLFETIQIPFNFIEREPAERLFGAAFEAGMGLIGMKPLGGGLLRHARLCFGFLRQYAEIVPIPGLQSKEELDEILDLYQRPPTIDQDALAEMDRIRAQLGNRFCRRCGYCQPCPQEIPIPLVLGFKSEVRRFTADRARQMGGEAMTALESCAECHECEEKCPYELPILEMMDEARKLYDRFMEDFR